MCCSSHCYRGCGEGERKHSHGVIHHEEPEDAAIVTEGIKFTNNMDSVTMVFIMLFGLIYALDLTFPESLKENHHELGWTQNEHLKIKLLLWKDIPMSNLMNSLEKVLLHLWWVSFFVGSFLGCWFFGVFSLTESVNFSLWSSTYLYFLYSQREPDVNMHLFTSWAEKVTGVLVQATLHIH